MKKLDWSDEKSVRAWLRTVSRPIRMIADMLRSLADNVDSAMPKADPAKPEEPDPPRELVCMNCGKNEAETPIAAGAVIDICESCTRLACGVLGIALSDTNQKG